MVLSCRKAENRKKNDYYTKELFRRAPTRANSVVFTDINYVVCPLHQTGCQDLHKDTETDGQPQRSRERKQSNQQRIQHA